MLDNIKAYQSETTSQYCPFQNSTLFTAGCLFSCYACLHSQKMF